MNPDQLRKLVEELKELRGRMLFEGDEKYTPEAESFFIIAINSLDNAIQYTNLTCYKLMKGE